jgi:hypothetical protein
MDELFGENLGRCGLSAGATTHQSHFIVHGDFATFDHPKILS